MSSQLQSVLARATGLTTRVAGELGAAGVLVRAGMVPLTRPDHMLATVSAARRWGQLGGLTAATAQRCGDRVGLVDELGELTYAEMDERANRLCNAWRAQGLKAGDGVALLARPHRGFLDTLFAAAKAGARVILLNTDFAGPQIRDVAGREGTALLVYDDEYAAMVDGFEPPLGRFRAWIDEDPRAAESGDPTIEELIAAGDPSPPPSPDTEAKIVVLTSGTTGLPKGAPRSSPKTLIPYGGLLGKVPFRSGETTVIALPLFHALGFAHALLGIGLGTKVVLQRRFDAAETVRLAERHDATALILVPTMLRRILDLKKGGPSERDLSALRIIFLGGSQLGGDLASRGLKAFGPVLYNLYGSTEVSAVTIATPDELLAAPDCVGTPPMGVTLRLYDDAGEAINEPHVTGRIFGGTGFEFEGYTGGGAKDVIDGLMSTGDVGHLDEAGRLFIDGRDDDMIVSGGENVFPGEIEELLQSHPDVVEASVIGVPDEQFGARMRAFVVRRDGVTLDEDAVKEHVRSNLARFKVPRDVVFLSELPRNPTGKVLKRELVEHDGAADEPDRSEQQAPSA